MKKATIGIKHVIAGKICDLYMFLDLLEMITSIPAKLASSDFAVGNYLIKVNIKKNKKNRTINEICSKFTIKISEQLH